MASCCRSTRRTSRWSGIFPIRTGRSGTSSTSSSAWLRRSTPRCQCAARRVRLHACWGNYEGPHDCDVALPEVLPAIQQAKVGGFVLPFANPRHAHEYRCLKDLLLDDDQVIIAGVIDPLTNFVEHPEVVADRIEQVARVIVIRGVCWQARIAVSIRQPGAAVLRTMSSGPSGCDGGGRRSRRSGCSSSPILQRRRATTMHTDPSLADTRCPRCTASPRCAADPTPDRVDQSPGTMSCDIRHGAIHCPSCNSCYDMIWGAPFLGAFDSRDIIGLIEIAANARADNGYPDAATIRRLERLLESYHAARDKTLFARDEPDEFVRAGVVSLSIY